jgi:hypothetical protein
VGSVPVLIQWIEIGSWGVVRGVVVEDVVVLTDEVETADHLLRREGPRLDEGRVVRLICGDRPGAPEGRVRVVDARVHDRDAHPFSPHSVRAPHLGCLDERHTGGQVLPHDPYRLDRCDIRPLGELPRGLRRQPGGEGVDEHPVPEDDLSAEGSRLADRALL